MVALPLLPMLASTAGLSCCASCVTRTYFATFAPDAELLLHAYGVWDTECVAHLLGDFVFAIWDALRQRLFAARDHFGIKPFFYAAIGAGLLFGKTLNCLRKHPAVSSRLNLLRPRRPAAIWLQSRFTTTTFAGI